MRLGSESFAFIMSFSFGQTSRIMLQMACRSPSMVIILSKKKGIRMGMKERIKFLVHRARHDTLPCSDIIVEGSEN
uniref:SJCHGC09817 protein n=1 Tax=Schistosoma japonicum TaxID=6182 RepID=Q5BQT4_SCHJA|nr:SJCHGC09817 protein [Schistosoma japonicum]